MKNWFPICFCFAALSVGVGIYLRGLPTPTPHGKSLSQTVKSASTPHIDAEVLPVDTTWVYLCAVRSVDYGPVRPTELTSWIGTEYKDLWRESDGGLGMVEVFYHRGRKAQAMTAIRSIAREHGLTVMLLPAPVYKPSP